MTNTFTMSEIKASMLIYGKYGKGASTNSNPNDIHAAANEIIALAEQIKAERSVAGMDGGRE